MESFWLIHIVAITGLLIGSYVDLKKREVPDIVNYSMMLLGFVFAAYFSYNQESFNPLLYSILGFILSSAIGLLLYYTGQWGGGDAKALMGIGALLGISFHQSILFQDLFIFVVNILFVGAIYGVFWIIYVSLRDKESFKKTFKKLKADKKIKKYRKIYLSIFFVFLLILLFLPIDPGLKILALGTLFLLYLFSYFGVYAKAAEEACMIKKISVNDLTEGDWVVSNLKINGKEFVNPKTGLSEEDIIKIRKSKHEFVKVKEGVPFVPSILIAYVFMLIVGNWFIFL